MTGLFFLLTILTGICAQGFVSGRLIGLIGSAATIFWLLVFGVNEERWKEQAGASASSVN